MLLVERTSTPTGKDGNKDNKTDGAIIHANNENEFSNPQNISPIPIVNDGYFGEGLHRIVEEEDSDLANKRKRDSFDDISMISIDSLAPSFASAKKPKLVRTGSITRTLRRSMSFVAMKTPVSNLFRTRRNSVDPNSSYSSITSIESTFNESIKKPIQEKLKGMRDRLTRSCKKDPSKTPKMKKKSYLSNDCEDTPSVPMDHCYEESDHNVFKTPNVPIYTENRNTQYISGESYDQLKSYSPPNSITNNKLSSMHSGQSKDNNRIGTPSRLRHSNKVDVIDDIVITAKSTVSDNSICPVVVAADKLPVYINFCFF